MKWKEVLGKTVRVTVDRPLGSSHPEHPDMIYTVNYGFIEGIPGGDGEWQDAYILGVYEPCNEFTGTVSAVIHRLCDNEDKWIVTPQGKSFTASEIMEAVRFCEQYFSSEIIL